MKKTEIIQVAAIPATERTVVKTICDIPDCVDEAKRSCEICKRDICKRHTVEDDYYGGDYYDHYCVDCARDFLAQRRALVERQDKEEEMLREFVRQKSLGILKGPCPCMTCSGYCGCGIEGHHA